MQCQQWSWWTIQERRQTKLITEKWISTVREREGEKGAVWKKAEWMNKWKHIGHPEFSPTSLLSAPTVGCFTASLPRLRHGARHRSSFLSKLPALLHRRKPAGWEDLTLHYPHLNPLQAQCKADRASRMAPDCTCTRGFPVLPLFGSHTETQPPDHNPLCLPVAFSQVVFKFTKTPKVVALVITIWKESCLILWKKLTRVDEW